MFVYRSKERKLQRLRNYNYSQPGWYFLTICTRFMVEWFGDVQSEHMIFNEYGTIANKFWLEIPNHYHNVAIDTFVIMPNHVHGIIHIIPANVKDVVGVGTEQCSVPTPTATPTVPTIPTIPTISNENVTHYGLISKIIMSYKNVTTKQIHQLGCKSFIWQRSFHDRIIQDDLALQTIRQYILNNPKKWKK